MDQASWGISRQLIKKQILARQNTRGGDEIAWITFWHI